MSVVRLQNISCEKQNRLLFSELNLQIARGELILLKGENGAGKTSLLRILVGLSTPQSGEVYFEQENIADAPDVLKQLIYVGHKAGNNGTLTAVQNLQFWCAQLGLEASADTITDILHQLQLEGLEDLPVRHLSAGQQRRVALARLWLHPSAKLWVLDEPFTALDVDTVTQLSAHLSQFVQQGGAVIFTSHQAATFDCKIREFILEYQW